MLPRMEQTAQPLMWAGNTGVRSIPMIEARVTVPPNPQKIRMRWRSSDSPLSSPAISNENIFDSFELQPPYDACTDLVEKFIQHLESRGYSQFSEINRNLLLSLVSQRKIQYKDFETTRSGQVIGIKKIHVTSEGIIHDSFKSGGSVRNVSTKGMIDIG